MAPLAILSLYGRNLISLRRELYILEGRPTNRVAAGNDILISDTCQRYLNKLASLEATPVRNSAHRPTHFITGVKRIATSIAKNTEEISRVMVMTFFPSIYLLFFFADQSITIDVHKMDNDKFIA